MSGEQFGPAMDADSAFDDAGGFGDEEMFSDMGRFETGAIPVDAAMRQGKAIRTRRRVIGGTALAVAAVLSVGLPVAVAGSRSSGQDVSAGSGPRIVVNRPVVGDTGELLFSGMFSGKKWSLDVSPVCGYGSQLPDGAECNSMVLLSHPPETPVDLLMNDVEFPRGDNYYYALEYAPETDYAVVTLSTGDQVTVPGIDVDSTHRTGWFPAPRAASIAKIVAYRADGTEIGHTSDSGKDVSDPDTMATWYRPDGTTLHSAPNVDVASGTTGGVDWSIEAIMGKSGRCFLYRIGSVPTTVCPGPGVVLHMSDLHVPGPNYGVILGEVASANSRVDVKYQDGTVQHLTPVVGNGHAFVGTYVPDGATVVSVTPMTGTNG